MAQPTPTTLIPTTQPDPHTVEEVVALLAAAAAADGVDPVSEPVLLRLRHGRPGLRLLARDGGGTLVGFANLDVRGDRATAELAVHPGHRGQGIGTALATAVREHHDGPLWVWAHGEHPAAVRIAGRHGMRRERELWQLRRDLADPLPSRPLPEGLSLRRFVPGRDEAAVVEVNNRAFAWHPEQSGWDVGELAVREGEPWFDPTGFLLVTDGDGRLAGFHWTKVHPGPPPVGEVYVLAVDPAAQGDGLGPALVLAGLEHLRDRGLGEVLLYTESDNEAAVRMYRKLGFRHHHTDVEFLR
ncbi:MAG: mycothiol synthase [Pseudonocardiaceae bacterium]